MTISIGIDPAARADRFAVAVLRGRRDEQGHVLAEVVSIAADSGIDWESHGVLAVDLLQEQDAKHDPSIALLCYFDATGAGQTTGSQLVTRLSPRNNEIPGFRRTRLGFRAVMLTPGSTTNSPRPGWVNTSRNGLVGQAVMAIRSGDIDLTKVRRTSPDAVGVLLEELQTFTSTLNERTGKERFAAAAGERFHDDLILAVALAYGALVEYLGGPQTTVSVPSWRRSATYAPKPSPWSYS